MDKHIGVYIITNLINGKNYIGYSNDIEERFDYHRQDLVANRHANRHLQAAWNKHGEENFSFSILDECKEEIMPAIEHFWSTTLKSHNEEFGYNILPTTICGILKVPREALIRGGLKRRGVKKPEGHGEKVSKALKGRKLSIEHRRKISERQKKNVGEKNYFYGRKHSEESRRKMSISRKNYLLKLKDNKNEK